MTVNTKVTRRTYRGREVPREERVYSGRNHGQERYLAGAWERMTAGGVQWLVDPKVDRTTRWRLQVDPMAMSYNEYWRYLLSHYMAQNVHPISIQGRRV